MFLPTGLIGGAIVGGGLTILSQTEAFRSLMFGKKDKDGNRSGGLISKNLKDKFKKAAPIAVGGAVTGMISSILKAPLTGGSGLGVLGMQLLPGGILGGAIMGMGVGLLKNSDTFKNILFGKQDENGERKGTWLSKSFGNMKQKMAGVSPFLKNALKGGAVGAVTGATLAHMGVLGAAVSSGPIGMGIAGLGLGIASSTKKFQDWLFGTEEFDDDGNSLGRKNGYLGRVKNMINANIIEPIAFSFKKNMVELVDWTKDKITLPFRTAFGPILDSISGIKDNVVDFVKDRFEDIGNGITSMIRSTLGKLFSPITTLIGKVGSSLISGAKVGLQVAAAPLAMGLQGLNVLTMGKRRKDYKDYRKAYLAQEEAGGMNNRLIQYWDAKRQDGQKVGFFDKISDTIDAYMGRGEIAENFRKGYVQEKTEQGQNNLGWLTAKDEKKQLRIDRRQKNKAFKQWEKVDKYGRKLANEFGGREVELTPAMFEKYKKKFVGLGVNADQINDSSDIMDLIYRPSQFKKKAAGDSGRLGELEALSKFRLTDEEKAHMATTEKYQTNVEKLLEEIRDSGKVTAEELMFDREMTSYKEDRKRDNKRLRNKLKKAYKTSLWEGKQAINLNDPELYEYDIEGITDEDLQDYAASNFADNNDFKGYLESIGRKMSPNDDRVAYQSAVKVNGLWKRSTGKTSEEKPPESKPNSTEGAVITNDTSTNVNETTTQSETNNRFDWKQATEEANRNKKKGKSSEEKPPESKPNTNDATQAAVLDELKQTRELQEANLELQSGGEITADKVKKNGYKDFGKSKMSKFSIGGVLTNLFNRKSKEDKTKEAAAKEAEEQKQATALGDETNQTNEKSEGAMIVKEEETKEKKKSIFSRIFGAIGSGFTIFGSSKIGKLLIGGVKLFGGLGLAAGIGLTIAEMTKPGTADKIGASIQKWNDETLKAAEDGTFIDNIKSRISGWFDKFTTFMDEKVLSKDGYLVKAATKVGETIPSIFENFVIPGIQRGTDFITKNADTIVGAAGDVLIAIAPPLAQAIGEVLPEVIKSLGKGLWNNATGKKSVTKGKENLTTDEQNAIIEKGGSYKDNWVEINEEEAITAQENGMDVKQDTSGKYYVNNAYTLDSNKYIDKSGKERTAGKNSFTSRLKYLGARVLSNAIIGNHAGNATIAKTAIKGLAAGAGGYLGGITHMLGGIPGMIAGGATGTTVGYKLGDKLVKAGSSVLNKLSPLFSKFTGKTATKVAAEGADVVLTDFNKAVFNTGTKAITENAGENALSVVLQNGAKTAGSGIDDVAKIATSNHTKTLQKLIDVFKTIPDSKIVKTIAERFGSSKLGAIVKGVSTWCKNVIEKLGRMVLEVSKGTKLGKNITKILTKAEENNLRSDAQATTASLTAGLSEIIFVGYGMISGATHPEELFEVSKSSVDWKMRLIAALIEGLLNSTIGLKVSIVFMLLQLFLGFNAEKWVASFLYKNISIDKEERTAKQNFDASRRSCRGR